MENLLVYRARFGAGAAAIAKVDQPSGAAEATAAPLASAPAPAAR
jgi:hypothetical protein